MVLGDELIEFGEDKNSRILVEDIAVCFRDSGIELKKYDETENILGSSTSATISNVTVERSPGAQVLANANLGETKQQTAKNARLLLAELLLDLERAEEQTPINGYLLFDRFVDADSETQRFFQTRVLPKLSQFRGIRFVVEDKPDLPQLERNVMLDESCEYHSTVLDYTVTIEDVLLYCESNPSLDYSDQLRPTIEQLVQRSKGYPDVVASLLEGLIRA